MRRMEILLGCDTRTIERKIAYLADQARAEHARFMAAPVNRTNLGDDG